MIRRRLISILSAIALVLCLFTLLPEVALKAKAAGRLNISTSYNAETGKLTVSWTPYNQTCGYTLHFYNEVAEGENQGQYLEMPDMSCKHMALNAPSTTYTTEDYFGQLYGNGGKKYKVLIVCEDNSREYYREFSEAFETGTTILPTPENPTFCENGLIFWNDDWDKYTDLSVYNYKTNNRVTSSTTQRNYTQYLIDDITQGEYYFATIQNIARGDYRYRYSKKVTTNSVQYKGKTDVLGAYWEGTKLCWIRYPGAESYDMEIQADLFGVGSYSTLSTTNISIINMRDRDPYALLIYDMKKILCQFPTRVKIRFAITALDSNGNKISNTTTTAPTIYKRLAGDVNNDCEVDRVDANLLSRYVAGWDGYDSKIFKDAADLNDDGEINRIDANILSRCVADWDGYREKYIK